MKFANLQVTRKGRCTVGDDIQLLAVENLYRYMGIDYRDVVRIPFGELSTYKGEYVVLPLSFPFYGYSNGQNVTNFSDHIIPVFLGFASTLQEYTQTDIEYLRRFEPIGCRDLFTLEGLRSSGVMAYMNGCLTVGFPRRRNGADGKKTIFCVDVPESFKKWIPEELRKDCVFTSHLYFSSGRAGETEQKAREVYETYIQEARMVVSTRLHAVLPCLAAGIPVILAKDEESMRFSALSGLIPVYTKENYAQIDWDPDTVECEELKEQVLKSACERVMGAYRKYKDIFEISSFYEKGALTSTYIDHFTGTIDFLQENYRHEDAFSYALWAATPTAELVYKYISKEYPNAQLRFVIDQYKSMQFYGHPTQKKDVLEGHKDICCFVCAGAAMPEAKEYFAKIGHENFYMCWHDNLTR